MTTPATTGAASTALAALGNLKGAIQNVKASVVIAGGDPILRLGRDGKWVFGAENLEPEEGSRWAVNPLSLRHGIVCWKVVPQGSKESPELFGKHLVSATQPKPAPTQAHDKNGNPVDHNAHPWADVIGVDFKCISGEDDGEQVIYEPSSTGGLNAMSDLMDAVLKAIDEHPERPVAIIELESDHYNHKTYGKTYIPKFKIVDWVSMDGVGAAAPAPEEPKVETAKVETAKAETAKAETKSANEPEPQTQEQSPEPAGSTSTGEGSGERRRRRRAA